ncbi:MAG: CPBP family intramembrane glutamic endopeptidase [Planctomycetota bacterium]
MPSVKTLIRFPTDTPARRLSFSTADLAIGLGFVAMIFLDKVLLEVGGQWIDWPEQAALGIRTVASLGLIAGTVFFIGKAFMAEGQGFAEAGLVPRRPIRDLLFTLFGLPAGVVLTYVTLTGVNLWATKLGFPSPEVNHGILQQMQSTEDRRQLAALVLTVVTIGPLLEELVFRGLLQTILLELFGRAARWRVVLVAAAVFSLVHVGATTWHALPGLFVLGVVLGWLYERTGSLWPAILVHAGFNGLNVWVVLAKPEWVGA